MNRKPPIRCTPGRVNIHHKDFPDEIKRYRILADGSVAQVLTSDGYEELGLKSVKDVLKWELDNLTWHDPHSDLAKMVRKEAARLRRNRYNREKHQALRDLGMTKTKYGWE